MAKRQLTSAPWPSGCSADACSCLASFADRLLQERIRRNRSHQQFDYDEAAYEGPLDNFNDAVPGSERLVVVANRLPVTCIKDAQGQWQLQVRTEATVRSSQRTWQCPPRQYGQRTRRAARATCSAARPATCSRRRGVFMTQSSVTVRWSCPQVSAGGLVSALKGVSTYKTVWIGWPGRAQGDVNTHTHTHTRTHTHADGCTQTMALKSSAC